MAVSKRQGVRHGHEHHPSGAPAHGPSYLDHCVEVLRQSGSRVTRSRLAVIQCLAAAPRSMTPRSMLETIRRNKKLPDVDQVTIYRILEAFAELGLVHRVGPTGEFIACAHIGCANEQHILTRCLDCGRSEELDLPGEILSPVVWYLTREVGFEPSEHFLQLNGLCASCRKKRRRVRS